MAKTGIRAVAERAGVAVGTVSRVLNDHPSVTAELRARVKAVIEEFGYRPDPFARSLRSKVSRLIGIIIPDLTNPFFSELVQCAEQAATAYGHNVILMTSFDDVAKEADCISQLASRKVDGIVIAPCNRPHAIKVPKGTPVVTVDRLLPDRPGFAADHRGGARMAVEYLARTRAPTHRLHRRPRRLGAGRRKARGLPGRDRKRRRPLAGAGGAARRSRLFRLRERARRGGATARRAEP